MNRGQRRPMLNSKDQIRVLALLITLIGLLTGCGVTPSRNATGEIAPSFRLPATTGEHVSLSDLIQQRPVLLYFHMAAG